MDPSTNDIVTHRRNRLQSSKAVIFGLLAVIVLSLATDQVLHMLNVYPPWGQPMYDPALNLLALAYRIVYGIIGGYIAARFAPHSPMRHALVLGIIGLVLGALGAIGAIAKGDMGPSWYPILLALTAVPTAWLGSLLYTRKQPPQ